MNTLIESTKVGGRIIEEEQQHMSWRRNSGAAK